MNHTIKTTTPKGKYTIYLYNIIADWNGKTYYVVDVYEGKFEYSNLIRASKAYDTWYEALEVFKERYNRYTELEKGE